MATKNVESLVLVGKSNGTVIIPSKSPLKRLNYFDGKFLRASDLKDEQNYLRHLVRLSNQAGGSGAVHGFDLTLGGGDTLNLGPGLGINGDGRVLLLPQEVTIGIQELIDLSLESQATGTKKSKEKSGAFGDCVMIGDTTPVNQAHPSDLYLIVLFPAEALCGEEDVYGKLCEEACATSTDRPYAVEGLIVRAIPLVLQTPLAQSKIVTITSKLYLRSRIASAYFEDERLRVASMISKFGLAQDVWCLGAEAANGNGLPIGVIARAGSTTVFLDAWIARRERMDTPPRRYWQWRMMMRPWDVFLAQILQFQCQLSDLFDGDFTPAPEDPCGDAKAVISEAARKLSDFLQAHKELSSDVVFKSDFMQLESMSQKLTATEQGMKVVPVGNRMLIQGGILELPSAGYLPVLPNANTSVQEQVSKMMGEGVDLRFCAVRPDFVAHALEEAQHMERISLIQGLEDSKLKPEVDILVPDGELIGPKATVQAGFAADAQFSAKLSVATRDGQVTTINIPNLNFKGAARAETLPSSGIALHLGASANSLFSALSLGLDGQKWRSAGTGFPAGATGKEPLLGLWVSLRSDTNLLLLKPGDKTNLSAELVIATSPQNFSQVEFSGQLKGVLTAVTPTQQNFPVEGTLEAAFSFEGVSFPLQTATVNVQVFAEQQGSVLVVQLFLPTVGFILNADLSNPDAPKVRLRSLISATEDVAIEYELVSSHDRDETISSPGNQNHVLAVKGLEFIGNALKEQNFVDEKSKLLFTPNVIAQTDAAIRATRDWVLFHRRRNKNCGTVAVAAPARTYRVYQAAFTTDVMRTLDPNEIIPKQPPTKEELLKLTAQDVAMLKPIGVVTFGGGVATLAGDSSAVQNAWQKIPGGKIIWAAIASSGDAVNDGDTLASSRLKSLESILDQVDPSARADVLPIVPPPLASADVDGVIVLFNAAAPAAENADLVLFKAAVAGQHTAGRIVTFDIGIVNDGPSPATDVKITDAVPANTTFLSATAPAGWSKVTPVLGGTGEVVFQKASVAPTESAKFQIVVVVGRNFSSGTIDNVATIESATSDPNKQNNIAATATTFTAGGPLPVARTSCLTIFAVFAFGEVDDIRNDFNRGSNPLLKLLPELGAINFQERTANVTDSSLLTTRTNWVKKNIGGVTRALLIMRKDAQPEDAEAFRKQATAIRAQFPAAQGTQPLLEELQLANLPAEIKCQAGLVLAGEEIR